MREPCASPLAMGSSTAVNVWRERCDLETSARISAPDPSEGILMSRTNLTEARKQAFLDLLRGVGGRSGNKALAAKLSWDDEFYSRVQAVLISEGKIRAGRGRGG